MEMLLNIIDHFSDVIHSITQWTQVTRPGAACTDTDPESREAPQSVNYWHCFFSGAEPSI